MEYMFLPLKRYAAFSGRSRRMEYWMWVVFQILVWLASGVLISIVSGAAVMSGSNPHGLMAAGGGIALLGTIFLLVWLGLLIPSIAVAVRRLHDTDWTGWWLLAPLGCWTLLWTCLAMAADSPGWLGAGGLLAMIGGIGAFVMGGALLVFMLLDGTPGSNRFGLDPKGRAMQEVFA